MRDGGGGGRRYRQVKMIRNEGQAHRKGTGWGVGVGGVIG